VKGETLRLLPGDKWTTRTCQNTDGSRFLHDKLLAIQTWKLGINYLIAVMKRAFLMTYQAFLVVVVEMRRVEADDLQDCAAFGQLQARFELVGNLEL
jgi:hypothetical protein